ncbi:hypothetical protein L1049_008138 [Liquidambar formosana]|uniref:Uncharacterized protein n=1 Tax=Liquidambar formosana TaxID=63359 RepID=A0AAP0X4D5_LIQFO
MAQNYRSQCVFGCSLQNFSFLGRLLTLVAMQADKQQRWRIYVHAKATNFDLKLKATKILPTWMLYRVSIMLKLHQVLLKVKSESQPSMPTQGGRTLKSKFLQILEKIRARRAKNRANATNNTSNLQYPQIKFPVNLLERFAFEVHGYFNFFICS